MTKIMNSLFNPAQVNAARNWEEMILASGLHRPNCTVSPELDPALILILQSKCTLPDLEAVIASRFNKFELQMLMMALEYRLECMRRQAFAQEAACLREAALHEALLAVDPQSKKEDATVQELSRELASVQSSMSQQKKRFRDGDQ